MTTAADQRVLRQEPTLDPMAEALPTAAARHESAGARPMDFDDIDRVLSMAADLTRQSYMEAMAMLVSADGRGDEAARQVMSERLRAADESLRAIGKARGELLTARASFSGSVSELALGQPAAAQDCADASARSLDDVSHGLFHFAQYVPRSSSMDGLLKARAAADRVMAQTKEDFKEVIEIFAGEVRMYGDLVAGFPRRARELGLKAREAGRSVLDAIRAAASEIWAAAGEWVVEVRKETAQVRDTAWAVLERVAARAQQRLEQGVDGVTMRVSAIGGVVSDVARAAAQSYDRNLQAQRAIAQAAREGERAEAEFAGMRLALADAVATAADVEPAAAARERERP